MGRSFVFECSRCGFRATVAGRADRGVDFQVQTLVCHECKRLYDAVTKLRVPHEIQGELRRPGQLLGGLRARENPRVPVTPPSFEALANRLRLTGARRYRWVIFKEQCPKSASHPVQPWNSPGKCPRCGMVLDKNVLPYRLWD